MSAAEAYPTPPISKLCFLVNLTKSGAREYAAVLVKIAEAHGVETSVCEQYPPDPDFVKGYDACCAIGGDGTLLGLVPAVCRHRVPVLGVNRGKLGFLATFSLNEAEEKFPELLRGAYKISERSLMEIQLADGASGVALNDVVVKDHDHLGLIELDVRVGDSAVTHYSCDGLIFSSPTGSTAYNLSAGGPLIHPDADVFAMTPICPHTLSNRSVIFAQGTEVIVDCREDCREAFLTLDGRHHFEKQAIFPMCIRISRKTFPLMQFLGFDHFEVVRNKLRW